MLSHVVLSVEVWPGKNTTLVYPAVKFVLDKYWSNEVIWSKILSDYIDNYQGGLI